MKKMSEFERFKQNIETIEKVITGTKSNDLNYDNLRQLYSGFGGTNYFALPLSQIRSENLNLSGNVKRYYEVIKSLISTLEGIGYDDDNITNIFKNLSNSSLTAFYTPEKIVTSIAKNLLQNKIEELNSSNVSDPFTVLDPSAGTGVFAHEILNEFQRLKKDSLISYSASIKFVSIEPEHISRIILYSLKNKFKDDETISVQVHRNKFEDFDTSDKFDIITSNIPFGNIKIFDKEIQTRFNVNPNIHNYFFLKSSLLLKENGTIGFVTSSSFLDTPKSNYREMVFTQGFKLDSLVRLPKETFQSTEVQTDYLQITKAKFLDEGQKNTINKLTNSITLSSSEFSIPTAVLEKEKAIDISYNINQYVYDNVRGVLVGEWYPSVFNQTRNLTSTCKDEDQLIENFNALLQNSYSVIKDVTQEIPLNSNNTEIQEISEVVILKEKSSIQMTLFDLEGFLDNEKGNVQEFNVLSDRSDSIINDVVPDVKQEIIIKDLIISVSELEKANVYHYNNAYVVFNEQVYFISIDENNKNTYRAKFIECSQKFKSILDIKNTYLTLNDDLKKGIDVKGKQSELISKYESFVKLHGSLNNNLKYLVDDFHLSEFKALEVSNGKEFIASELLKNKNFFDKKSLVSEQGAIFQSLQIQKEINVDYIFGVLNLKPTKEEKLKYVHSWIEKGYISADIYKDHNDKVKFKLVANDEFTSGNVPAKIELYENVIKDNINIPFLSKEQVNRHLDRLKLVDIRLSDINDVTIHIGNEWMNKKYLEDFLNKTFEIGLQKNFFEYNRFDGFHITSKTALNAINRKVAYTVYRTTGNRISPAALLKDVINDVSPFYTNTILVNGEKKKVLDKKAIGQANQKSADIKRLWNDYLQNLPEQDKQNILKQYNDKFCSLVPREFNGDYLDFSDINGIIDLGKHQKDAVAKILHDDGSIIDIKVGGGKSLIMFASVMKMKELGLKNKPVITALNSTAEQIYNEFKFHYPDANIFYDKPKASIKNKVKISVEEARREMYAKIANNDWDCVIMTHEQICNIPVPFETEVRYIQDQIDKVYENFYYMKAQAEKEITNTDLKKLEFKVQNTVSKLEYKLDNLRQKRDDTKYDIISMGIDHILVDECHKFKKMPFTTIHQNVSGLPTDESGRANYMKMLTEAIREKYGDDKGLTLLSGTIANNSIAEIYIMMEWAYSKKLQDMGLGTFDKFAKVFFEKSVEDEISVTSATKPKERFRSIVNIPELKKLYKSMAIVKNDYNLTLDKPELDVEFVSLDIDDQQQYLNDMLIDFCEGELDDEGWDQFEKITGKTYGDDQMQAASLITTNFSRLNSIDAKLINPSLFTVNPSGKLHTCAKNIKEYYDRYNAVKGTQLVFSDFGLPNPEKDFDAYNGVIEILVNEYKIPREEIAIVHDWQDKSFGTKKDKELRKEFDRRVNTGEIRVAFGSTDKLGTGRNVQKRVVAMHHIDIPWNPSNNEQRNGRGARQGNEVAKKYCNNRVKCFYYASKKSLDAFLYQTLEYKEKYISEFKKIDGVTRIVDEGAVDAEGNVNYKEMKGYILDNKYMIEVAELERKIESLENIKQGINYNHSRINNTLMHHENTLKMAENNLKEFLNIKKYSDKLFENVDPNKIVGLPSILVFQNGKYLEFDNPDKKVKEIGELIHKQFDDIRTIISTLDFPKLRKYDEFKNNFRNSYTIPLYRIGNFEMKIEIHDMKIQLSTQCEGFDKSFIKRQPIISQEPKVAIMTIYNEVVNRSQDLIDNFKFNIAESKTKIDELNRQKKQVHFFDKEDLLQELKFELIEKRKLLEQENQSIKQNKANRQKLY